jgi:hypothetical protein
MEADLGFEYGPHGELISPRIAVNVNGVYEDLVVWDTGNDSDFRGYDRAMTLVSNSSIGLKL